MEYCEQTSNCGSMAVATVPPPNARWKPSQFNAHTTLEDGTLILYNSLAGHVCALTGRSANIARGLLSGDEQPDAGGAELEYLIKKGYLINSGHDEAAVLDSRYAMTRFCSNRLELTLLASEECNFRCVYCSQKFRRGNMTRYVAESVVRLVANRIKTLAALRIVWFGGEPLLAFNIIEELAPRFVNLARDAGVHYSAHMTTNGYLLTADRLQQLVAWGCDQFQITLDGAGAQHDSNRPLATGGGTFDVVFRNLVAARNCVGSFQILVRVNFDAEAIDRLPRLLDLLAESLGSDERFSLSFQPVGRWGGPNDALLRICGNPNDVEEELWEMAEARGLKASRRQSAILRPASREWVCAAALPYAFVIGADGRVMKCTNKLESEAYNVVGRLRENGDLTLDEQLLARWVRPWYLTDSVCRSCFLLPVCYAGFCPMVRVSGRHERRCPAAKTRISETLRELFSDKQKQSASGRARS